MLLTARGTPVPPQDVVRRLRQLSPRLSVEWIAGAWEPYWGLKVQWPPDDPRWERVRRGELSPDSAFDLDHMFPKDCSAQDMAAYVEQRWGDRARSTDTAKDADKIVEDAKRHYADVQDTNRRRVTELGVERYERESPHDRRVRAGVEDAHPMVPGGLV